MKIDFSSLKPGFQVIKRIKKMGNACIAHFFRQRVVIFR